jgi:hypothetical protein
MSPKTLKFVKQKEGTKLKNFRTKDGYLVKTRRSKIANSDKKLYNMEVYDTTYKSPMGYASFSFSEKYMIDAKKNLRKEMKKL